MKQSSHFGPLVVQKWKWFTFLCIFNNFRSAVCGVQLSGESLSWLMCPCEIMWNIHKKLERSQLVIRDTVPDIESYWALIYTVFWKIQRDFDLVDGRLVARSRSVTIHPQLIAPHSSPSFATLNLQQIFTADFYEHIAEVSWVQT